MTSNSRARAAAALALALLAPSAPTFAEAPLPAVRQEVRPAAIVRPSPAARVRLVEVRLVEVGRDDRRVRILAASADALQTRSGVLLAARVATPFTGLDRTASPVIVIGGRPVDSFVDEDRQTVYALLPSWAVSARPVSMQVGWLGDFDRTLSNPVSLSPTRRPRPVVRPR